MALENCSHEFRQSRAPVGPVHEFSIAVTPGTRLGLSSTSSQQQIVLAAQKLDLGSSEARIRKLRIQLRI